MNRLSDYLFPFALLIVLRRKSQFLAPIGYKIISTTRYPSLTFIAIRQSEVSWLATDDYLQPCCEGNDSNWKMRDEGNLGNFFWIILLTSLPLRKSLNRMPVVKYYHTFELLRFKASCFSACVSENCNSTYQTCFSWKLSFAWLTLTWSPRDSNEILRIRSSKSR